MLSEGQQRALGSFDGVKRSGDGWLAHCPAHDDRHPSLTFKLYPDGWLQPHCQAGCSRVDVLAAARVDLRDIGPDDSRRFDTFKMQSTEEASQKDYEQARRYVDESTKRLTVDSPAARRALEYVSRRFGLTAEQARSLKLGVDPGGDTVWRPDGFSWSRPQLVVPFLDPTGVAQGFQARRLDGDADPRWVGPKGSGWAVAGCFSSVDRSLAVVTEGPGDALALASVGLAVVFVRGASNRIGEDFIAALSEKEKVLVVGDNDEAGEEFAQKCLVALRGGPRELYRLRVPDVYNDVADWAEALRSDFASAIDAADLEPFTPPEAPSQGQNDRSVDAESLHSANVIRMSDVVSEDVSWLWKGRIPQGKLTVLEGDPGVGKSTLALDVAARVSTGRALPGDEKSGRDPAGVLLLTAEDGLGDTVRPRLEAAGADLTRIHVLDSVADHDEKTGQLLKRPPEIPRDIDRLEEVVVATGAKLVIVDVLDAFLEGGVNSYVNKDVRRALMPLAKMAERQGCAVIVLRHLNKARSGRAMVAGQGSIGISGAARAVLVVAPDPDDESEARKILAVVKCNVGPPVDSFAFTLAPSPCNSQVAAVNWVGTTKHRADDLVESFDPEERSAAGEAAEWLEGFLVEGEKESSVVKTAAKTTGIAPRTLQRAKTKIGVRTRSEGFPRQTFWALPSVVPTPPVGPSAPPECVANTQSCQEPLYGTDGTTGEDAALDRVVDQLSGVTVDEYPSLAGL